MSINFTIVWGKSGALGDTVIRMFLKILKIWQGWVQSVEFQLLNYAIRISVCWWLIDLYNIRI